ADGQEDHCLRRIEDDGPDSDPIAVGRCRDFMRQQLATASAWLNRPPPEQILLVDFTLDFYGQVETEVWAPAYYLGRTLHTLQDSFAHTIRSKDMRRIHHVMNFVEALSFDHDEARDGLPHSSAIDECQDQESAPMVAAAITASAEYIRAAGRVLNGDDLEADLLVLDKWLVHEAGCTINNNYCESEYLAYARSGQTEPFVTTIFGCSAAPSSGGSGFWLMVLALLAAFGSRRFLFTLALVASLLGGCSEELQAVEFNVRTIFPSTGLGDQGQADSVQTGIVIARLTFEFGEESAAPATVAEAQTIFDGWIEEPGPERLLVLVGRNYAELVNARNCDFGGHRVLLLGAHGADDCFWLRSVRFDVYGPAFLAGVAVVATIADEPIALMTPLDSPDGADFIDGFQAGLAHVGHVPADVVASTADDAQQQAETLFQTAGAVVPTSSRLFAGILRAAEAGSERYTCAVDTDQTIRAPGQVIASVLRRFDLETQDTILTVGTESFQSGRVDRTMEAGGSEIYVNPRFDEAVKAVGAAQTAAAAAADARQAQ
ncbi:MAG: MYXO-CTERM domain-containing protein, partial [Myxococcota bacterium]